MTDNPFYDEWRECLREHYLYVIRNDDMVTEPTLRTVLMSMGFTEEELDILKGQGEQQRASEELPS
jgi:hypothetical protein